MSSGRRDPLASDDPFASDDDGRPPRLDLRLLSPALGAWSAAWVALAAPPEAALGAAALLAACGVLLLLRGFRAPSRNGPGVRSAPAGAAVRSGTAARIAAAALLLAAAAGSGAALRVASLHAGPLPSLARDGASARVQMVVTGDPQVRLPAGGGPVRRDPVVVVRVRVERVTARGHGLRTRSPVVVLAPASPAWQALAPGERVEAAGRFVPSLSAADAATLRARGDPVLLGGQNPLQRLTQSLRVGLRRACTPLPEGPRGLVPGLVVGDTSRLPPELLDDFRAAGLTHLTAVSGANVAILVGALLLVLRWLGVRGRALPAAATVALAGFVVLARPQPSVLRAAAMGLVMLAALATGRRHRGMPSLCAAVIALVLLDPWQARSYGFALSVVATASLLMLAPWLAGRLTARGCPLRLAQALAVPVAATATTAPIGVLLSGSVSLVAVPANLLAEPAVAPATVLGLLSTLLAPVSMPAATACAHLASLPAAWIVLVAGHAARLPHAAIGWPGGVPGAAALAATLLIAAATGPVLLRRAWTRRVAVGGLLGLLGAGLWQPAALAAWPPAGWVMVACDVGQGDALVINAGDAGAVVVDAGPDPQAVDRCLRDLGVQQVALVLLTHMHADHVEGLPGVLHGRSVAQLQTGPLDEPPEEARRVAVWARQAHLAVQRARFGEERSLGPLGWQILGPLPGAPNTGPNDASLVILLRAGGLTLLLTGDVEPPAQKRLRTVLGATTVDVLKVPHHGSAHQDPQLLTSLHPRLAIVSVGVGNTYGHPAAATLALLRAEGAVVGRTDEDGDLAVTGGPTTLRLVRRRQ